jgi:hypothetical protein
MIGKSVLSAWQWDKYVLGNGSLEMGMKPLLTLLCPLWRSPNGRMVSCLSINFFLPIQSIGLTVIMSLMAILLRHGEVPCDDVLISWRSSNFANFPSTRFLLDLSVTFRS